MTLFPRLGAAEISTHNRHKILYLGMFLSEKERKFILSALLQWIGRQTLLWSLHKVINFSCLGPELFRLISVNLGSSDDFVLLQSFSAEI